MECAAYQGLPTPPAAVTAAAAAATELLGRVQASLTAGFNVSAAAWSAVSAPVIPLPDSSVGLRLAAPAAAKILSPAPPSSNAPQVGIAAGLSQEPPQMRMPTADAATKLPTTDAGGKADAEPA